MFRGVQHINMDAKGRLAFPARQREPLLQEFGGQIVTTIDTQSKCLLVYPQPVWDDIQSDIQELPALNPAVRRFQRLLIGYATDMELDNNGRVLMPTPLREYAGLEKKLVLAGQGKKLELWAEDHWLAERDKWLADSHEVGVLPDEMLSLAL